VNLDFSLIHSFQQNGLNIILDVNSGAVHSFSIEAWDYLKALKEAGGSFQGAWDLLKNKYEGQEITGISKEIEALIEDGTLFSSNPALESYEPDPNLLVKALCLHVAHDCNLRCRYCFAGAGDFGGSRSLMDAATGKQALDMLFKLSGARKHVEVDYFGGEPLMNFPVVRELIEYGREQARSLGKILKQTLTTNALLLDRQIGGYLKDMGVSLIFSIDGRPEVHDRMRPFTGGQGSYERVSKRIAGFLEYGDQEAYYVRGTYTRFNRDFSEDVLHLVKAGFKQVSLEPVVASLEYDYALREEDLPHVMSQYDKLAEDWYQARMKGEAFDFFHFNISLDGGPCLPRRLTGCGAGNEYMAVTPEGDLYPCHQFVGNSQFRLGTVWEGPVNGTVQALFKKMHVFNKDKCRTCWARFFCGGGCHANAYSFNKDLGKPYDLGCEIQKKRLETAIYLQVKLAQSKGEV
jgi:uncharacterized protein